MKLEIELSDFEAQALARLARDCGVSPEAEARIIIRAAILEPLIQRGIITEDEAMQQVKNLWRQHWGVNDEPA
jgi:hypothetical protein